jgi:hypothetical protein
MSEVCPRNVVTPEIQRRLAQQYTTLTTLLMSKDAFTFGYRDDEGNELFLISQDGWIVYEEHPRQKTTREQ